MDSRECVIVQKLITELDDTRAIFAKLVPLLIRPHLKFLAERLVESHAIIADDLARQMDRLGGLTARRSTGIMPALRASIECWLPIASSDIEVGCLKRLVHHEARVTQRFQATLDEVKGLHQNLQSELCQLDRVLAHIESLMHEMQASVDPVSHRSAAAAIAIISTQERPGS